MNKSKLVNMKEMLQRAKLFHYAIAQININNLEWAKAALEAAQETATPIILGVSEGAVKYMWGYKTVVNMVNAMIEENNITVPVCLHLDHGTFRGCVKALEAGFSSVMFDGSKFPIEKNIVLTNDIANIAKKFNASTEAEVGGFDNGDEGEIADIDQALDIANLPIDAIAFSFGSIHGIYPKNWKGLNFDILDNFTYLSDLPVVLHGGSGIPDKQIKTAISLGVCKINVNTECQLAFAEATRRYFEDEKDLDFKNKGYDPRKILKPGYAAIKKVCIDKFKLFGSFGVIK